MYSYLKNLENRLNDDQKDIIKRIYEPTVVATPLSDSRRDLCILPDGEIRSYGNLYAKRHMDRESQCAYLSSKDGGLSWSINYSHGKMNACTYLEKAGIYIASCDKYNNNKYIEDGLYIYRSKIGPDDPDPEVIKLSDESFIDTFQPQQSAFSDRIWFTTHLNSVPHFFFSDDFGKTWEKRSFPAPHHYEVVYPNKGMRWSRGSGTEPYACELSKDKMLMIIRTPSDCFYKSYSYDGGNSWSEPEPSDFYGTNTTAFLLRLTDGRVITFWNNTKPLAQLNHKTTLPPVDNSVKNGTGENAFTNRDAAHAAISDDGGETFVGYREILLNGVRNNADFRYIGGAASSADKSVHQFQAFQLPFNKILVSAGQNKASRRLVIFDIDWLYETTRKENFHTGIGNISCHTYLKSISATTVWKVGNGHCSWNRTYCAYPVPDPDGGYGEVLSVSKHRDDRLINDIGGMGWNFPLAKSGRVSVDIKIAEKQARFILSDRWYNPCDPHTTYTAPFWFELDVTDTGTEFVTVNIDFDTKKSEAQVYIGEEPIFKVKMSAPCTAGISYLIMQCATDGDSKGFYIKSMKKK